MSRMEFRIHGMDCAEEAALLRRELGPMVAGESKLSFDLLAGKLIVEGAPEGVSAGDVVRGVSRAGLRAEPLGEGEGARGGGRGRRARIALTLGSGCCGLAGFLLHAWLAGGLGDALGIGGATAPPSPPPWPSLLAYGGAVVAGLWRIAPKAWLAARRLRPDMNLLVFVAACGAIVLGQWFEAAALSFLFSVSLLLESWSIGRARRAVEALLDMSPPAVRLLGADGREREVRPEEVPVGSPFLVKPGERIALDGRVVRGTGHVNQAPITGESMPVEKAPGDEVFAGTVNGDSAIEVESTKPAQGTILAHIIRQVREAQANRSPSEQWVERFARYYTPAVLLGAVGVCLVPPLLFHAGWGEWFYRSLVLLVIGCPCALVISTPVSIVAALAVSARNGVLVKGGLYMEEPARIRAVALDKTGTLTLGTPAVVEVVPLAGHDAPGVIAKAAALEARSEHPIAGAILAHAARSGVSFRAAREFRAIPGKGATGRAGDAWCWLGSHRYLEERGQETEEIHRRLEEMSGAGRSVVVLGNEEHVCGLIAVADPVRPDARAAIDELRAAGVDRIVMLTGDNEGTARSIAEATGVDEFRAELLPGDKVSAVEDLASRFTHVAMVGDGVNDAPALGRSSLGVAIGAAGSDVAIETADVALMSDELGKLPWLIRHSRGTVRTIRQNIALSLSIKVLFVGLTMVGYASLWGAIAADMGASLLVVFNGLRVLSRRGGLP